MKGNNKDEEKTTGPLFPRLHINDTDKGGPRAPPRNKMALYEQLSIPSHRFNSGSASIITRPPNKVGNFLPSTTPTHAISNKRTSSSISGKPQPGSSSHMGERLHMYSSTEDKPSKNLDGRSQFSVYQSSSATMKPKSYFLHPHNIPMPMRDHDDYRVRHMKMVGHKLRESPRDSPQNNKKGDAASILNRSRILENLSSDSVREESPPPLDPLTQACEGSVLAVESNSDLIKTPIIQPETSVESREKTERIPSVENKACKSPNGLANDSQVSEEQFRFIQSDERGEITSALENPGVEPQFGDKINCPDSAAGLLGHELFWKARRAIVHQQRIFTFQLFELHRIMKVQKLIAASPDLLLFGNKLNSTIPLIPKTDIQKPNPISAPTPMPIGIDGKTPPFYFHQPPGNQWLVPVMSPSEGLIYKPISGAPQTGFMAPIYSSNDLLSSTPYGIPPIGQNTYFPPFGVMPVLSPSVSSSAVEQVSPLPKLQSNGPEDSLPNISQKNSCNISNQKTRSISTYIHKDSTDLQHSTASSPPSRVPFDALPLFPTTPTSVSEQGNSEQRTQVIKVIPHNPKSASESVSRIFKYIQEERMKYD
ncbi:protein EARLY FLOWERING 3-like [Impatiens glandulifera]|uniref:protein EARLY FLOWERING 3-like n=1 Tax=Impatiens glandulifera TaxID=253017 RepID=UPI001FB0F15D|nr:protein EARLY FLOWERING 3-like [Impatiens glandulifera]